MSDMLEATFRGQILELAAAFGWRVYSQEQATREIERKRTGQKVRVRNVNVQGVGFPDLVLVRRGVLIFAELKRDEDARGGAGGRYAVTPEQDAWLHDLGGVPGVRALVWRPRDYDAIEVILRPR